MANENCLGYVHRTQMPSLHALSENVTVKIIKIGTLKILTSNVLKRCNLVLQCHNAPKRFRLKRYSVDPDQIASLGSV